MEKRARRGEVIFPMVAQWFDRGQGDILTITLPLSLGCKDPIIHK